MRFKTHLTVCVNCGLLIFISACAPTDDKLPYARPDLRVKEEVPILTHSDSISLCWNYSAINLKAERYELGYKHKSDTLWKVFKSDKYIAGTQCATVYRNTIDSRDSIFMFGVRVVSSNGMVSNWATSSDSTSIPHSWIIHWKSN